VDDTNASLAERLRAICLALAELCQDAYRAIAPARLIARLGDQPATDRAISAAQPQAIEMPAPPWP
jgi:hypothetical protein